MPNTKLTAIILAGGQSSRMGQDKALIPIQGVPLLQRVYDVAQACTEKVYLVTPWPERYQDLILPGCQFIQELPLSSQTSQNHGPLVGFAQALALVETEWVLLLACDLPRLQVGVLQKWIAGLDGVEDEAIAALTGNIKGWEPLCGFYRRCCLPGLLEFINQGGRSFQQWLQQSSVHILSLSEPEMLHNCNTPADLTEN